MVDKMESRIYDLEIENNTLKSKIKKLEEHIQEENESDINMKLSDLEQLGRKNSIRIFGLDDTNTKETTEECVKKIVKNGKRKNGSPCIVRGYRCRS